jgi:predicted NUDIX family phosphoesterase
LDYIRHSQIGAMGRKIQVSELADLMPPGALPMILATSAENLPPELGTTGFHPWDRDDALQSFQRAGLWIGPRRVLEQQPAYRQIIPYVVLRIGEKVVKYTRTPSGGEARLHGKTSIGLGGHIDLSDIVSVGDHVDLAATINNSSDRELLEELGPVEVEARDWIGVLIDNDSDVGRVHIGLVGLWTLKSAPVGKTEDAIGEVDVCSLEELEQERGRLEGWSDLVLSHLRAHVAHGGASSLRAA